MTSQWPGGPPLNVGVNLPTRPSLGQAASETLFFYVFFVFVFVMVLHGFLDQLKCHKLSSRVGAVHVFVKLTDLEKYEKCTYICTSFRGQNGQPFFKVFATLAFLSLSPPSRLPTSLFRPQGELFWIPRCPFWISWCPFCNPRWFFWTSWCSFWTPQCPF